MSKLADFQVVSYLFGLKPGLLLAFVREPGFNWFPRKRPARRDGRGFYAAALVAVADRAAAEGRDDQARCLLEAAYILFDRGL